MGENGVEALRAENAAVEKMGSFKDTVELMQNNGIFVGKWQNPGKKQKAGVAALESARNRIGNKSLFEATVLPWLDPDGTLDITGLNKAMALLGESNAVQQREGQQLINDKRKERDPDAQNLDLVELVEAAKAAGGSNNTVESVASQLRAGAAEREGQTTETREANFKAGIANFPTHADLLEFPRDKARTRLIKLRGLILEGRKTHIDRPFTADFDEQEKALQEFGIRIAAAQAKQQDKVNKASQKDRLRAITADLTGN